MISWRTHYFLQGCPLVEVEEDGKYLILVLSNLEDNLEGQMGLKRSSISQKEYQKDASYHSRAVDPIKHNQHQSSLAGSARASFARSSWQ